MKKLNFLKSFFLAFLIALCLPISISLTASELYDATPPDASQPNGYTQAFAAPKTYDGTPYIQITDIILADVLTSDDVHATARGTLSSPNAGTYSFVNIDQIVWSGADVEKYAGLLPDSMADVAIEITVQKAIPEFSFYCDKPEGFAYETPAHITFTITNDFGRPEGLPPYITVFESDPNDPEDIQEDNAVGRSGNQYPMFYCKYESPFHSSDDYGCIPIWAEIPKNRNYESIESPKYSILVFEPLADYYNSGQWEFYKEFAESEAEQKFYTKESCQILLDIWESIDWNLPASQQTVVDEYFYRLIEAYNNLVPLPADYSEIHELIASIPEDLSLYTDGSVAYLQQVKEKIPWDLSCLEQDTVDDYKKVLRQAIYQLRYKPADYTKVEEAIARIPDDLSVYTDESVKALKKAQAAIKWNKKITDQKLVDNYAAALEKAIQGLEKKPEPQTQQPEPPATPPTPSVPDPQPAPTPSDPTPQPAPPIQPDPAGKLSAKTGDSTEIGIWMLLLISAAGITVFSLKNHKRLARTK